MKKIIFILVFLLSLFLTKPLFAAKISFDTYKYDSKDFLMQVILDTESDFINAVEGKISFPTDLIEIKEIRDGNSSINLWVEKPTIIKPGEISFSGITPGGFIGSKVLIFSIILSKEKEGTGEIKAENIRVIKNSIDGEEVKVGSISLPLPISTNRSASDLKNTGLVDLTAPEIFTPEFINDKNLFDGKSVLVFLTQDKDSGISYYEVREGYWGKFEKTQSPYILKNQKANQRLYIKAVDNTGNERVVKFSPPHYKAWYQQYGIIVIILIVFVFMWMIKNG